MRTDLRWCPQFVWHDGRLLCNSQTQSCRIFTPGLGWGIGQPDDAEENEDCVTFKPDLNQRAMLNDRNCNEEFHYVCEKARSPICARCIYDTLHVYTVPYIHTLLTCMYSYATEQQQLCMYVNFAQSAHAQRMRKVLGKFNKRIWQC